MRIPITKPFFDEWERKLILKSLESGWLVQGPYVRKFEKLFAEYTNSKFAKATSNCTSALHLALESLGIKSGDKVIVPSFTYVASANAVEYTGAEIVFCDIDLKTFNIDTQEAERILREDKDRRIKAIMPVNLFGLCSDLPRIMELSRQYNLKVVEDSACGFGAYIKEKHSGTFGDAGCFSFHPRKVITTGEGGMLVTDNEEIAEKVSSLRDHGASKSDFQRHKATSGSLLPEFNIKGYNYRMTDLQGALGVCQMKKAQIILKRRRRIAKRYNEVLEDIEALLPPCIPEGYTHSYQSYVCIFTNGEDLAHLNVDKVDKLNRMRNRFMMELEKKGVATRQGTHAVHTLGYYQNRYSLKDEDYLYAYAADRLSVTLPLYAGMTDEEFDYVITNIRKVLK